MITEFLITLIVGLLATTLFILFVNNKKLITIIATILFCIYLSVLIVGVFSNDGNFKNLSFVASCKWAAKQISWSPIPKTISDFLINIIMLMPIGLYIGAICKKPLLKSIIIGFSIGLFIETMQFVLPISRSPQLSDMLLNGISAILGCLYMMFIMWIKHKKIKEKQPAAIEENINNKITNCEKEQKPITKN